MAVFCQNCGKELTEEMVFCPDCGTRRPEGPNENKGMRKTGAGGNIISRIWNSTLFTELAIRFGNILEIFEGILLIIISRFCFQESGFISKALGIFLLLGGVMGCFSAAVSLITRKKSDEIPDDVDVRKSKRNLCIGTVVIIIAMIIYKNIGGGTYLVVREVAFDDWGSETIGELIDANMKSPKWSQKKLDKNSKLVYVEGYCPTYEETIQIEFYYEKLKDGSHEVTLKGMKLPESNEEYDWAETVIVWGSFYNHIANSPTDDQSKENDETEIKGAQKDSDSNDGSDKVYGLYTFYPNRYGGRSEAEVSFYTDGEFPSGDYIYIQVYDENGEFVADYNGYSEKGGNPCVFVNKYDTEYYAFFTGNSMTVDTETGTYDDYDMDFVGSYKLDHELNLDEVS